MESSNRGQESALSLILSLFGLLVADAFFAIFIPDFGVLNGYQGAATYAIFFSVWGVMGFSLGFVVSRRARFLALFLVIFIFGSAYALSSSYPLAKSLLLAIPGLFNGAGLAGILVVLRRRNRTSLSSAIRQDFKWSNMVFRYDFLSQFLIYSGLGLMVAYYVIRNTAWIFYIGALVGIVGVVFTFLRNRERLRSK